MIRNATLFGMPAFVWTPPLSAVVTTNAPMLSGSPIVVGSLKLRRSATGVAEPSPITQSGSIIAAKKSE